MIVANFLWETDDLMKKWADLFPPYGGYIAGAKEEQELRRNLTNKFDPIGTSRSWEL